ncbi:MAG: SagB/ThcOx family dehydrogenase [Betaproteobacteria bacterium]|nr:SagB/ThcOx family dehydrogenase [Betaproteobacteria bacterium]
MSRPDSSNPESAAAAVFAYHEASKHRPDRYAPGPGHLDWANQPDPFRRFEGAPAIALALAADGLDTPFNALHRPRSRGPAAVNRESVAVLLELSLGLSAWKAFRGTRWALRCNPSSGNLHPTEGYVVCPDMAGLDAGVYHYLSRDHLLEQRARVTDPEWNRAFPRPGAILGLASIVWREAWKYGMRAYRYCQHDCGHAIAAISYAAAALGWGVAPLDAWGDRETAALLGLDRAQDFDGAEAEMPDLLLWVGPEAASVDVAALLAPARTAPWHGRANRLSAEHRDWQDIARVEAAAVKPAAGPLPPPSFPARPALADAPNRSSAADLIRQRRSAVDFDGVRSIPADPFFVMMDALLPRPGLAPWDAFAFEPQVHPALFVHRVDGLDAGLYLLVRNSDHLPALKSALRPDWLWERRGPAHLPLYLLIGYDLRDAARLVSCHQEIAADSCFALGFLARFEPNLAQSPWAYRRLFWETGGLGQVLYLEAEAHGIRGTGMGCFFDDEMHRLLGIEGRGFQSLYHFTAGGAVEDPRLATLPPYAHLTGRR